MTIAEPYTNTCRALRTHSQRNLPAPHPDYCVDLRVATVQKEHPKRLPVAGFGVGDRRFRFLEIQKG